MDRIYTFASVPQTPLNSQKKKKKKQLKVAQTHKEREEDRRQQQSDGVSTLLEDRSR